MHQNMNDDELRKKLNEDEYRVLRLGGTEAPFSGRTIVPGADGMFHCRVCGSALFEKSAKFESGTGWPSFDRALPGAIREYVDTSEGMRRIEIRCAVCDSHLGHVFDDGPTSTGKRYCTNSVCFE
jgi:peptide-methionine (R)-S-oxide reductase